ncbi:class I SAM-dependent methyltransferase [Haliea sp. E1-2-M8]|uniref:class I SAM-dependent methyltransferase n=1 Tax=Haliea sp. E1-2-M8 TaxID=3064706 RepID=UPI002721841F|nr:class I SAM-dependent methyltransferase [Haliea sp. E1-2-M8]MDO8862770.1 class I SAM-dependent methyltransferase [Haliea sp. E1-2-M8]
MQTVDFRYFALHRGERVLDLGCGEGRHVIAAYILGEVHAVGVDLSGEDLRKAQQRFAEFAEPGNERKQLDLTEASALALPFPDASFDKVICSEVLEHIPDYRAALREVRRVLKPSGLLCVSVPRRWPERLCWALSKRYHQTPGGHLRIFRAERLWAEVEQLGFVGFHRHGAHALHGPYWWLRCLFWREGEQHWLVRQYHRLLVWDMLRAPWLTRTLEKWLNPIMGKSVVFYFRQEASL